MTKKINKKQNALYNLILVVVAAIFNLGLVFVLFNITRYANVSKGIFVGINIGGLIAIILINILSAIMILNRKATNKLIMIVVCAVLALTSIYGSYAVMRVNKSVDKIVTGENTKESLDVAFVTYNNSIILNEKDIEGSKFGIIGNEEFQEGNVLAKAELASKKIDVTYIEYDTYNDLLLGLVAGEVDVAALPANYRELFITNDGYEELLDDTRIVYEFKEVVEVQNDFNTDIDVTKDPFAVLVMGNDGGRTDTLILMTVNPTTFNVTMTSIPRDSYVPIACYAGQSRDKITHARQVSRQCTIDSVEKFLDIDINFFIETNFKGVVEIVDALGGIQIDSPVAFTGQNSSDDRGHYTIPIYKGVQLANGEQALAFARERYHMPNGDFDRQKHQQEVIQAMVAKAFAIRDVNKLLNVLDAAGNNIKTNMSVNQMTSLVNYAWKVIDTTYVGNERALKMWNSGISGYGSHYYNASAQLPLWIMIPWKGAVADAKVFIKDNLVPSKDKPLVVPSPFEFSIAFEYEYGPFIEEVYNEKQEVIEMPDFMPNMAFNYTLSEAQAWANARGIKLNITYVREGDNGFVDSLANGTIISQSVRYGTLTNSISSISIQVIQKLSEEDMIPNFVGQSYSNLITWAKNNGYTYNISWIESTSSNYVSGSAGLIATQDLTAGSSKNDFSAINVSAYDYPIVTESFKNAATNKSTLDSWAANNLINGTSAIKYTYVYSSTQAEGTIKSYAITNYTGNSGDNVVKTNSTISAVVYTKDTSLATKFTVTFVGKNGNVLQTFNDVVEGHSVTPPTAPNIDGFKFVGWSSDAYKNVTGNLTINALYEAVAPIPTPTPTPTPTPEATPTPEVTPTPESTENPGGGDTGVETTDPTDNDGTI